MNASSLPRLGVLFSGGGRTLENLARKAVEGSLPMELVVSISSHAEAAGIERARRAGIPVHVVDYREAGESFQSRLAAILADAKVDWVALAGFIRRLEIPADLRGRVVNIHPALLPKFGGRGFYGDRVHQAVIAAGERTSGCTVHFVTEEYDRGPVILQRVVPVLTDDTPSSLAARVFEEECRAYPAALKLLAERRVRCLEGFATIVAEPRDPDAHDRP